MSRVSKCKGGVEMKVSQIEEPEGFYGKPEGFYGSVSSMYSEADVEHICTAYFMTIVNRTVNRILTQDRQYISRFVGEDISEFRNIPVSDALGLYAHGWEISPQMVHNPGLSKALCSLCSLELALLNLYYGYEYSDLEIACMLGMKRQKVNKIRLKLVDKLRRQMRGFEYGEYTEEYDEECRGNEYRCKDGHSSCSFNGGYGETSTYPYGKGKTKNKEFTYRAAKSQRCKFSGNLEACRKRRPLCDKICSIKI